MHDKFDVVIQGLERLRNSQRMPGVFGESAHSYRLHPVLTEAEVLPVEAAHGIRLPDDYRQFITRVGNGGAGPYYGMFKLGEMDHGFEDGPWGEFVGRLASPFPHTSAWNDLSGMPRDSVDDGNEEEREQLMDAFERQYWDSRLIDGAIPICHLGCALRQLLVITGPEAGNVWCDDRADYRGLQPFQANGQNRVTFFHWYHAWLNEALSKL